MGTWTTIENALYAWSSGQLGIPVHWANQDVPEQDRPMATLNVRSRAIPFAATDEQRYTATKGVFDLVQRRKLILSVNVYCSDVTGDGHALARIEALQKSVGLEAVKAAFSAAGLAVVEARGPVDLTAVLTSRFESRAQMDVVFGYVTTTQEDLGYIETSDADGTLT